MSTTQPNGAADAHAQTDSAAVALTAAEQVALASYAGLNRTAVAEGVSSTTDPEELERAIERARGFAALWRASERGTLDVTPEVVAELRRERKDTVEYIETDLEPSLAKLRAGDADYTIVGCTQRQSVDLTLKQVREARAELEAYESILARVGGGS